jgi:PAP_fibrillin
VLPATVHSIRGTASSLAVASTAISSAATALTPVQLQEKWESIEPALTADLNVVAAGGWYNVQTLHAQVKDPKSALVRLIVDGLLQQQQTGTSKNPKVEFSTSQDKETIMNALLILLFAAGKGFEADLVEGEWSLVYSKQGLKSPKFQKVVGRTERAGLTSNIFDTKTMTFSGDAAILKKGILSSTVQYAPLSQGYSLSPIKKSIVLRRIACDIVGASWKFWFLPRIPLPLTVKGGYLEFVYMDKDIRITKGNRGGLFVHFRPDFLRQQLSAHSTP